MVSEDQDAEIKRPTSHTETADQTRRDLVAVGAEACLALVSPGMSLRASSGMSSRASYRKHDPPLDQPDTVDLHYDRREVKPFVHLVVVAGRRMGGQELQWN